jgi:hypothetical protein
LKGKTAKGKDKTTDKAGIKMGKVGKVGKGEGEGETNTKMEGLGIWTNSVQRLILSLFL